MPLIDALEETELDDGLVEELAFFRGTLGGIPNSVRTMARVPEIAHAFTELNKAVMKERSTVTPELKRLIGYLASFGRSASMADHCVRRDMDQCAGGIRRSDCNW